MSKVVEEPCPRGGDFRFVHEIDVQHPPRAFFHEVGVVFPNEVAKLSSLKNWTVSLFLLDWPRQVSGDQPVAD